MQTSREQLLDLTNRFMDAFNRNDLDTVLSFFSVSTSALVDRATRPWPPAVARSHWLP